MADLSIIINGAVSPSLTQGLNQVSQQLAQTALMGERLGGSSAAAVSGLNNINGAAFTARQGVQDLSNVFRDLPFAINNPAIGANAFEHVAGIFNTLRQETGSFQGALSALGASLTGGGGLLIGISLLTTAFSLYEQQQKKAEEAVKKQKDVTESIFTDTAKEVTNVQSLVIVLNSEAASRERKLAAIKDLQRIQPEVFAGLKLEGDTVTGLTIAYQKYLGNLETIIAARIKQQQLEDVTTKLLQAQGVTQVGISKTITQGLKEVAEQAQKLPSEQRNAFQTTALIQYQKEQKSVIDLQKQQGDLLKDLTQLQAGIKVDETMPKEAKEAVDKVAELLQKLKIAEDQVNQNPLLTYSEKDKQQFDLVNNAIKELLDLKVKATNPIILKLKAELADDATLVEYDKIRENIQKTIKESDPVQIPVELSTLFPQGGLKSGLDEIIKSQLEELSDYTLQEGTDIFKIKFKGKALVSMSNLLGDPEDFKKEGKKLTDAAAKQAEIIADTVANAIDTVAQDLGAGKSLKGIFSDIGNVIGEGLKELGKQVIADSVLIKGIKEALDTAFGGNALAGIALGFALEFAGSAIESHLPKFADGGLAYGPTVGLFGEYAGAANNPEVVAPLDKLKTLIGGESGYGGTMRVVVDGQISGGAIRLNQQRASSSFNRKYGVRTK